MEEEKKEKRLSKIFLRIPLAQRDISSGFHTIGRLYDNSPGGGQIIA